MTVGADSAQIWQQTGENEKRGPVGRSRRTPAGRTRYELRYEVTIGAFVGSAYFEMIDLAAELPRAQAM